MLKQETEQFPAHLSTEEKSTFLCCTVRTWADRIWIRRDKSQMPLSPVTLARSSWRTLLLTFSARLQVKVIIPVNCWASPSMSCKLGLETQGNWTWDANIKELDSLQQQDGSSCKPNGSCQQQLSLISCLSYRSKVSTSNRLLWNKLHRQTSDLLMPT